VKRILVLGGAGFIGLHLIRRLTAEGGVDITAVDNHFRGRDDEDLRALGDSETVRFIECDLTDRATYHTLGGNYDEVYLLAGIVGVAYTESMPEKVVHTNSMVVLNTLEWLKESSGAKLAFTSTSETYAGSLEALADFPIPTPEDVPLAITDILNPRFSYAASKIMGEAAVAAYARAFGIPSVIIRYHNIYGPRMGYEHVIPELSLRILRGEDPFRLYGADQRRAFCYVSDAVEATVAAMAAAASEPEIFHIGNDADEIRIDRLLDRLFDIAGFQPKEIDHVAAPHGSPSRRCPSITKARDRLGFEPRVDLDEGLLSTFDWYRGRHADGNKPTGH
jgi:UDP-glucose 4-epimerase/UDP-glucuronate decarboxylase